jgi:hypothetical protein
MESSPSELFDLFPEADYRHRMRFQQGTIAGFFGATEKNRALLSERGRWLNHDPSGCVAALPEAESLLAEATQLLRSEGVVAADDDQFPSGASQLCEKLQALGRTLEPDLLFLRNEGNHFRLMAGCVCFPSSWSLAEKIGRPLEFIHDVVPSLNEQLAQPITAFLAKMQPGTAWLRSNWGLSRSPELNQHPARNLPKLDALVDLENVWVRIEEQALVSLPAARGVLFGIRIAVYPLPHMKRNEELARRFCRALRTMPEPMVSYKNLTVARKRILELMD